MDIRQPAKSPIQISSYQSLSSYLFKFKTITKKTTKEPPGYPISIRHSSSFFLSGSSTSRLFLSNMCRQPLKLFMSQKGCAREHEAWYTFQFIAAVCGPSIHKSLLQQSLPVFAVNVEKGSRISNSFLNNFLKIAI